MPVWAKAPRKRSSLSRSWAVRSATWRSRSSRERRSSSSAFTCSVTSRMMENTKRRSPRWIIDELMSAVTGGAPDLSSTDLIETRSPFMSRSQEGRYASLCSGVSFVIQLPPMMSSRRDPIISRNFLFTAT